MIFQRIFAGLLAGLLLCSGAFAQNMVLDAPRSDPPPWVLRGTVPATLNFKCAADLWYQAPPGKGRRPDQLLTVTRATPPLAYAADLAGIYYGFAPNTLRYTNQGCLVEEARTNDALWSRDMTNAAWVKVGATAALNAVGIDNNSNTASTLTATGTAGVCTVSCTALQSITLGSTADTYSVFLKRVTGTGTVNITINNLTGATACTLTTTTFTRCSVTATLANPVVGIQMTAVGDVIVADFNQMEPGSFPLSPIPTTTVAVARAADVPFVTNPPAFGSAYTLFGKGTANNSTTSGNAQVLLEASDGTTNNRTNLQRTFNANIPQSRFSYNVAGVANNLTPSTVWPVNILTRVAASGQSGSQAISLAGDVATTGTFSGVPLNLTQINIGSRFDGTVQFDGYISEIAIFATTAQPAAQLQAFGSR